jgi:hypothetical protein
VKFVAGIIFLVSSIFAGAQARTEVVPGIQLTSDALVWLVYSDSGKDKLSPVPHHDAEIVDNLGSNIARSAVFAKQKKPVVISGAKADIRIHQANARLFVQLTAAEEKELSRSTPDRRPGYAIIRLEPVEDKRLVGGFEFSRFKGKAKFSQTVLATKQERFNDSPWLQVTPLESLPPGEYALVQIMPREDTYSLWVFDFAIE